MDLSGVSGGDHGDGKAFVTPLIASSSQSTTLPPSHGGTEHWGRILLVIDWRFYEFPVNVFFKFVVFLLNSLLPREYTGSTGTTAQQ